MTFAPNFNVTVEGGAGAGTRAIKVRGELDSGNCDAVVAAFHGAVGEGALDELTLDLQEVSFIDSAGTRAVILIEQSARERGVALVVMPPPDEVTELLRVAGVVDRITLSPAASRTPSDAEFAERVELELPAEPQSPSRARKEVRELMAGRLEQDEVANLVLLTSELVTNAVVHPRTAGETPIGLRITTYDGSVRVEVEDAGEGFDPAAPIASEQEGGRGLFLVDSFAAKWGTRRAQTARGQRFRVWFELDWREQPAVPVANE
jgi:anti-anti-sigma factor